MINFAELTFTPGLVVFGLTLVGSLFVERPWWCRYACPMGLNIYTATTITSVDCMSYLECVGECPREGALQVKVGLPLMTKLDIPLSTALKNMESETFDILALRTSLQNRPRP